MKKKKLVCWLSISTQYTAYTWIIVSIIEMFQMNFSRVSLATFMCCSCYQWFCHLIRHRHFMFFFFFSTKSQYLNWTLQNCKNVEKRNNFECAKHILSMCRFFSLLFCFIWINWFKISQNAVIDDFETIRVRWLIARVWNAVRKLSRIRHKRKKYLHIEWADKYQQQVDTENKIKNFIFRLNVDQSLYLEVNTTVSYAWVGNLHSYQLVSSFINVKTKFF